MGGKIRSFVVLSAVFALIVLGCSELREKAPVGPIAAKLTYEEDIRPILDDNCASCHGSSAPMGDYNLSTYFGILGYGSDDIPNAIPGDPNSLLVAVTQPGGSEYPRVGSEADAEKIRRWVVEDSLALSQPTVHPQGWLVLRSDNFHGQVIRDEGWDLLECQRCHGADYTGGISKESCNICHLPNPEACNNCHGSFRNSAPPEDTEDNTETTFKGVGAHQTHVADATVTIPLDCSECHIVPISLDAPGHIDGSPPAEITWGELAQTGGATPSWDGVSTCRDVYCHGEFRWGNKDNDPVWTRVGEGESACGTCHGLPPGGKHPSAEGCSLCHSNVVEEELNIIDKTLHINGTPDMGF